MKTQLELYGTLGPADYTKESLRQLFQAGMTGIRLNLSHSNLEDCETWLQNLFQVANERRIVPELLVDLQGPELRIGTLSRPITLTPGSRFPLPETIPLPAEVIPYLKNGQILRLDDGKIILQVVPPSADLSEQEQHIYATVLTGGILTSRKSLSLDGQSINLPTLTAQDQKNLQVLQKYHVTGVMLPFVRHKEDLLCLQKTLHDLALLHVRIFAKIENQQGVEQLPSLLPYCDQIVIARGDLGNAYPLHVLPGIQKKIAHTCLRYKRPFMVVTQMLASMEHHAVPTRAEVSDIFNAVLDGASSLMLTGETAAGDYPVEAMQVLSDTAYEALRYKRESQLFFR